MNATTVAVDLAKNVFQVAVADRHLWCKVWSPSMANPKAVNATKFVSGRWCDMGVRGFLCWHPKAVSQKAD